MTAALGDQNNVLKLIDNGVGHLKCDNQSLEFKIRSSKPILGIKATEDGERLDILKSDIKGIKICKAKIQPLIRLTFCNS